MTLASDPLTFPSLVPWRSSYWKKSPLDLFDDKTGTGGFICAEARRHGVEPVPPAIIRPMSTCVTETAMVGCVSGWKSPWLRWWQS